MNYLLQEECWCVMFGETQIRWMSKLSFWRKKSVAPQKGLVYSKTSSKNPAISHEHMWPKNSQTITR